MPRLNITPGEPIDPHLDGDHRGETIEIPAGRYPRNNTWSVTLGNTTIEAVGGRVEIDLGDGHTERTNWHATGDATIRGIDFTGTRQGGVGGGHAVWAERNATIHFDDCRWPDGGYGSSSGDGDTFGIYLRDQDSAGDIHRGIARFTNVLIQKFPNNGIYGSGPNEHGGVLQVEGSVFRHNNISSVRFGGDGSYVRNSYFEVDYSQTPTMPFGKTCRGVWLHGAYNYAVENCDFVFNTPGGAPIHDYTRMSGQHSTAINNNRIENNGSAAPILIQNGSVHGGGNHLTGGGNLSPVNASHVVDCVGSGCDRPRPPGEDDDGGDDNGGGNGNGGDDGEKKRRRTVAGLALAAGGLGAVYSDESIIDKLS